MKKLIVFASGAGSNAAKIIEHFHTSNLARVSLIVCNKPGAGVLDIASANNIPVLLIEKENFFRGDSYIPELESIRPHLIILAGFLWKIPDAIIAHFRGRIVNIHPALLPKYGGKGMYGMYVHEAVIAAGENESGITIHYVDEKYDNGDIIFQARCSISASDTPASLAQKVHALEHQHFPEQIEKLLERE